MILWIERILVVFGFVFLVVVVSSSGSVDVLLVELAPVGGGLARAEQAMCWQSWAQDSWSERWPVGRAAHAHLWVEASGGHEVTFCALLESSITTLEGGIGWPVCIIVWIDLCIYNLGFVQIWLERALLPQPLPFIVLGLLQAVLVPEMALFSHFV